MSAVLAARKGGFTLVELVAAIAVAGAAMAMLIGLLAASRRASRGIAERELAAAIAQGGLERLRTAPPQKLTRGAHALPLPPEAAALTGATLTATVAPWRDIAGLRHVRVVLRWRARQGFTRELVREGLVSDHRVR